MRFLFLIVVVITLINCAVVPKSVHSEPHRLNDKNSVENEISDALKDLEESRKIIRMTVTMNDTNSNDEENTATFFRGVEDAFSGMMSALQNSNMPFFGKSIDHDIQSNVNENANQTSQDLLTRTRNELKEEIDTLRYYLDNVRMEFDEWMISNRHQEVKSMIIGGLSAVFVLVAYFVFCKCCHRRSRMNHLSAFANDGFSSRHGDNEGLLPTTMRKGLRHPSNSDEDI